MVNLTIQIRIHPVNYRLCPVRLTFAYWIKKCRDKLEPYHYGLMKLSLLQESSATLFKMSRKYRPVLLFYPYPKITIPIAIDLIDIPQFRPL
jgi:hypothetical protein